MRPTIAPNHPEQAAKLAFAPDACQGSHAHGLLQTHFEAPDISVVASDDLSPACMAQMCAAAVAQCLRNRLLTNQSKQHFGSAS